MRAILLRTSIGVAVVAGILVVILALVGTPSAGSQAVPTPRSQVVRDQTSFPKLNGPGASNRDRLRICVQSLVPTLTDTDVQSTVAGLLPQLRAHPDWGKMGLDVKPAAVENGCPGAPLLDRPGFKPNQNTSPDLFVKEASPYRLFIYVATPERLSAAGLGERSAPRLLQREIQFGDVDPSIGGAVASEVYITPAEVADTNQAANVVKAGLNLPPLIRTINFTPLRHQPNSPVVLIELAPSTLLVRQTEEFNYPGSSNLWIGVRDGEGNQGFVQASEVISA